MTETPNIPDSRSPSLNTTPPAQVNNQDPWSPKVAKRPTNTFITSLNKYQPLIFREPPTEKLNSKLYPLAHIKTPQSIRQLGIEIGGSNIHSDTATNARSPRMNDHTESQEATSEQHSPFSPLLLVEREKAFDTYNTIRKRQASTSSADNHITAINLPPPLKRPKPKVFKPVHNATPSATSPLLVIPVANTIDVADVSEDSLARHSTAPLDIIENDFSNQRESQSTYNLPSPCLSPRLESSHTFDPDNNDNINLSPQLKDSLTLQHNSSHDQLMTDLPSILSNFDSLPSHIQSYIMFHLLKRCPSSTLQFISSLIHQTMKKDFIGSLPIEISLNIVKYLDYKSLCRSSCINKRWHALIESDFRTWKNRFMSDGLSKPDLEFQRTIRKWNLGKAEDITISDNEPDYKSLYQTSYTVQKNWRDGKWKQMSFAGHGNNVVTSLQFDDDKIISGSDDQSINVYDTSTGQLRKRLEGHEGGVWALQYVGNTLVSGSTDRSVRVWDIETGTCTHVFSGHSSTIRCLQIILPVNTNPDPNQEPVYTPPFPVVITGSRDTTLRVWKLPSPKTDPPYKPSEGENSANPYHLRTLIGHNHSVRALAGAGDIVVSGSYDNTLRVWNFMTGECLHHLFGHTQKVYSVVLDKSKNRCMSGSMDGTVKIWNILDGTCLHSLEGHLNLVGLLDLCDDYLVSAGADSTLRVWSPNTGICKHILTARSGAITCFQHDKYKVISGSEGTLKMWDIQTGQFVRDLLTNLNGVWQVKFDERRCVAAVKRGDVTWFEVLDFGYSQ